MNLSSGSSRRQEAHSNPNASSGKKIRASLPRLLRKIGVMKATRAAFTLIELILVMALLLIVVGVAFPSLQNFFRGRSLDSEVRRFLSLTRYAQSRAVSESIPMVLWLDAREGTYGLQADAGYLDNDSKAVEYTLSQDVSLEASAPPLAAMTNQRNRTAAQTA